MPKQEWFTLFIMIGPGLTKNMWSNIYVITQECTSNILSFMMQLALKLTAPELYLNLTALLQDLLTIK